MRTGAYEEQQVWSQDEGINESNGKSSWKGDQKPVIVKRALAETKINPKQPMA